MRAVPRFLLAATLALTAVLLSVPAALAAPATAGPRRLIVRVPSCPGPLCPDTAPPVAHAKGKRIVWLVFDGVTLTQSEVSDDAPTNKSAIVNSPTENVPAFAVGDLSGTGGLSRQAIIDYTVDELDAIFAPYDVDFVTTRPASGNYSSIVFGGDCVSVANANCGGIALLDCTESMPNNITFVFTEGLDYRDLAPTAAQESAHAFGLAHTVDDAEVMYPIIQPGFYPDHFGATNASCPSDEVQSGGTCNRTTQNSHQSMLTIIGPRGQDVYGPEISITSHTSGQTIRAGDVITAEISDVAGVSGAELLIGNAVIGDKASAPWTFSFPEGTPTGNLSIGVRATDTKDNQSTSRVELYLPSGDEQPCDGTDDDCPDGQECNGEYCVPDNGISELGESCAEGPECESTMCGDRNGDKRCTQQCTETTPCPDGFDCLGGTLCWPADDSGGCGCRSGGAAGVPGLLAPLGMSLLGFRRRR